jgi:hypothetical protein
MARHAGMEENDKRKEIGSRAAKMGRNVLGRLEKIIKF